METTTRPDAQYPGNSNRQKFLPERAALGWAARARTKARSGESPEHRTIRIQKGVSEHARTATSA
ncbi:MAG: hypothetical protein ACLQBJ_14330 [Bryobacteraceae bacterium]